eukprot:m.285934 g.285934  ORF g.285934 m.285934 type:complete len:104 (-) comp54978_c0_seq15:1332-1643(-)
MYQSTGTTRTWSGENSAWRGGTCRRRALPWGRGFGLDCTHFGSACGIISKFAGARQTALQPSCPPHAFSGLSIQPVTYVRATAPARHFLATRLTTFVLTHSGS